MHLPGWLDLDGVANMRDIGGLMTEDGRGTRPGRLIRSDNLQDLSARDVAHLLDLGVSDIVDLRAHAEAELEGPTPLDSRAAVTRHHLSLFAEQPPPEAGVTVADLPWRERSEIGTVNGSWWAGHYLGYLATRPDSVVAALRVIAEAEGTVIVHCAAGKDRTGTVIALALRLVGVPVATVVADYVASAQRVEAILARLTGRPAYAATLPLFTVDEQTPKAATMEHLLSVLDDRPGGTEAWLADIGWTPHDTGRLRAKLLEAAEPAEAAAPQGLFEPDSHPRAG